MEPAVRETAAGIVEAGVNRNGKRNERPTYP
jgi:hypothetical protein